MTGDSLAMGVVYALAFGLALGVVLLFIASAGGE
jgi:hypothetical protein